MSTDIPTSRVYIHQRCGQPTEVSGPEFVALAEATGLILPLGAWTLRRALEAASRWSGRLTLSVNISALQFNQPRFVAEVDAARCMAERHRDHPAVTPDSASVTDGLRGGLRRAG